ncbi:CCC motif membrane protein [Mariniflexile ostreae]|uniref:CCC motif membrane protein n=1 Tax=Mariniflexile ostreae TaxID=1520892 RepID=A0ABV5FDL1_9FLAO
MEKQTLQNSTLILIFGIFSILTCCCYGVLGLIMGITALVLAKKATDTYRENPELYKGFQNVRTGKVLAIVGIILSVLYIIFMVGAISYFGWNNLQDEAFMQEKIQELLGR